MSNSNFVEKTNDEVTRAMWRRGPRSTGDHQTSAAVLEPALSRMIDCSS